MVTFGGGYAVLAHVAQQAVQHYGWLGALLATWVTFVPSFLFIFLGAPHIERLRGSRSVSAALTGTTAAVAGVTANLSDGTSYAPSVSAPHSAWPQRRSPPSGDVINNKELPTTRNCGRAASFRNPPPHPPGHAR
ncbi:chromate transporter [Streptomyces sp. NBC_01478]